ncbi:MAG: hypothetical protein ACRBFS_15115 [Aureispira sp.]
MKKLQPYSGLWLFLALLLSSCGEQVLAPADYVNWMKDPVNGHVRTKTIAPLEVIAQYKTTDFVIANEKRSNTIEKSAHEVRQEELEGMHYWTLQLSINDPAIKTKGAKAWNILNYGIEDKSQEQERLMYFSYAMQRDLKLIEGQDTLACALYHFERSYDLSKTRTFVLGFPKGKDQTTDKTLLLDLPYFNTGPIKINYPKTVLDQAPRMRLEDG